MLGEWFGGENRWRQGDDGGCRHDYDQVLDLMRYSVCIKHESSIKRTGWTFTGIRTPHYDLATPSSSTVTRPH